MNYLAIEIKVNPLTLVTTIKTISPVNGASANDAKLFIFISTSQARPGLLFEFQKAGFQPPRQPLFTIQS